MQNNLTLVVKSLKKRADITMEDMESMEGLRPEEFFSGVRSDLSNPLS